MSTRCQIGVKGSKVLIYKHCDGYPSEVLPTLVPIMRRFREERGDEVEYAIAQIMRAFARRDEERRKDRYEEYRTSKDAFDRKIAENYGEPSILGWGVSTIKHGDIEYFYEVNLEEGYIRIYNSYEKTDLYDIVDLESGEY